MKIKELRASFGGLDHKTLYLNDGLNIICAPNEGGKSTWSAFVRAMFYGIPTRERDKQGYIAEKNRYQPWSGAAMEGSLTLEYRGRDITLRRGPKGNVPFGFFEAIYTATGETVPGVTGENAGERLLGVPREVFERSAFVGQGSTAIDGAPALEARIAALASSGEEDVSSMEVERQLKTWRNRRQHNRTGLIPKSEEELAQIQELQARQAKAHRLCEEAGRELDDLSRERVRLQHELQVYADRHQETQYREYKDTQANLSEAQSEVDRLQDELNRHGRPPDGEQLRKAQEELNYLNTMRSNVQLAQRQLSEAREEQQRTSAAVADPYFDGMEPEQAWEKASEDSRKASCQTKQGGLLAAACVLLAGAAGLFAAGSMRVLDFAIAAGAAGGCALLGVILLFAAFGKKRRQEREKAELLDHYNVQLPDDILKLANDYRERYVVAAQAEKQVETVQAALDGLNSQREETARRLLELVHTFEPGVKDGFGVSAAISRALVLQEKLTVAQTRLDGVLRLARRVPQVEEITPDNNVEPRFDRAETVARLSAAEDEINRLRNAQSLAMGERNSLGDPAALNLRKEELEEELTRRAEEYDALSMALDTLEKANSQLQERFSPTLNQRAGEIFAALTGGKYQRVTLTRQFEALGEEADAITPRRAIALSQGTADQLYLAVRLAMCDLAFPEESVPVILDDALVSFDDARMKLALEFLAGEAVKHQILLFTCHSREAVWAEKQAAVSVQRLQF